MHSSLHLPSSGEMFLEQSVPSGLHCKAMYSEVSPAVVNGIRSKILYCNSDFL